MANTLRAPGQKQGPLLEAMAVIQAGKDYGSNQSVLQELGEMFCRVSQQDVLTHLMQNEGQEAGRQE